jgi:nucleoside-diphosphate-sugar epimerase
MAGTALIAGVGGIVGNNLARHLVAQGWRVEGLARRPPEIAGVTPIAADLLDPTALARALEGHAPSHVFLTTWLRQAGRRAERVEKIGDHRGVDADVLGLRRLAQPGGKEDVARRVPLRWSPIFSTRSARRPACATWRW